MPHLLFEKCQTRGIHLVAPSWGKGIMHSTCIFCLLKPLQALNSIFVSHSHFCLNNTNAIFIFLQFVQFNPGLWNDVGQYFSWGFWGVTTSQHLEKENLIECRCMGGVMNLRWHCFSERLNMLVDASSWTFWFCFGLY